MEMRGVVLVVVLALAGCNQEPKNPQLPGDNRSPLIEKSKKYPEDIPDAASKTIEDAVRAHGGELSIKKLRIAQVKYTMRTLLPAEDDMDLTVEETYRLPGKMRKVMKGIHNKTDIEASWAINGDTYWFRGPDGKVSTINDPQALEKNYRPFLILDHLLALQAGEMQARWLGDKKMDEGSLIGVSVTLPTGPTELWFHKNTGLLAVRAHKGSLPGTKKEGLSEIRFGDYKHFDGVKVFRDHITFHNGKKVAELKILDVRTLDKIDDNVFAQPR
jgi:hypothetical protein